MLRVLSLLLLAAATLVSADTTIILTEQYPGGSLPIFCHAGRQSRVLNTISNNSGLSWIGLSGALTTFVTTTGTVVSGQPSTFTLTGNVLTPGIYEVNAEAMTDGTVMHRLALRDENAHTDLYAGSIVLQGAAATIVGAILTIPTGATGNYSLQHDMNGAANCGWVPDPYIDQGMTQPAYEVYSSVRIRKIQ